TVRRTVLRVMSEPRTERTRGESGRLGSRRPLTPRVRSVRGSDVTTCGVHLLSGQARLDTLRGESARCRFEAAPDAGSSPGRAPGLPGATGSPPPPALSP